MEDNKLPEHLKNIKFKPEEIQRFMDESSKNIRGPFQQSIIAPNVGLEKLKEAYKKKSFRETTLFWIAVSSILIAVASLIVSIIALKH